MYLYGPGKLSHEFPWQTCLEPPVLLVKGRYWHLRSHVCPRYCWSTSVCGRRPPSASTVPRCSENPDGCTFVLAFPDQLFQPPSTVSYGTCICSHPRTQYPLAKCTLHVCPNRKREFWKAGTFVCKRKGDDLRHWYVKKQLFWYVNAGFMHILKWTLR